MRNYAGDSPRLTVRMGMPTLMAVSMFMLMVVAVRMARIRRVSVNDVAPRTGDFRPQPLQNARQSLPALQIREHKRQVAPHAARVAIHHFQ